MELALAEKTSVGSVAGPELLPAELLEQAHNPHKAVKASTKASERKLILVIVIKRGYLVSLSTCDTSDAKSSVNSCCSNYVIKNE